MLTHKNKILLIEDSESTRLLYRRILESDGFYVVEAENGQNGLKLAVETNPDLIILDLILPDIHGLEVLKSIRSENKTKTIPVLVLTTVKEAEEVQKTMNLGANYYAYKGNASPQKVLDIVHQFL